MNALTDPDVGKYLNDNFVSSHQKVGTFRVVQGQKQGGNVATYFCLPDGRVLHVLAGAVDSPTLLREARWVVETRKLALLEGGGDPARYVTFYHKAHADRLEHEHGFKMKTTRGGWGHDPIRALATSAFDGPRTIHNLSQQGKVHWLLAAAPLARLDQIYKVVFEKILGETVSTQPVQVKH